MGVKSFLKCTSLATITASKLVFLGLHRHLHADAHLLPEDTLLQYNDDTLLLLPRREEPLLPLPHQSEEHHLHHSQNAESRILLHQNKEVLQLQRDVLHLYLPSIGRDLPPAGLIVKPDPPYKTNGIHLHHGLELLIPLQVHHRCEGELHLHPREGSLHLQALDPSEECQEPQNPRRQSKKNKIN